MPRLINRSAFLLGNLAATAHPTETSEANCEQSPCCGLGDGNGVVRVLAIDPSEWELDIARSRITDPRVTFVNGTAQEVVRVVDTDVDAILLCNVLHQVPLPERLGVLTGAFQLVRPGGFVGANTLFYEGGIEPQTRAFYLRWIAETREYLAQASIPWSVLDNVPVALQRLTPQQHHDMFKSCGYKDIKIEEVYFDWRVDDWAALSKYSVFIQGALSPRVNLEVGSSALIHGVHAAYRALGIETVRRGWLHCAARRPW